MEGNWIDIATSLATVAAAVATALTAFLLWRQDRRAREAALPMVECTIRQPLYRHPRPTWEADITLRNFGPSALYVTEVRLTRPRGWTLQASGSGVDEANPARVALNATIAPFGATRIASLSTREQRAADVTYLELSLGPREPPASAATIKVRMVITIEQRMRETRSSRIAISRIIKIPAS